MNKKAFTLTEAMLTMIVLGAIAATLIILFNPTNQKNEALIKFRNKMFTEIENITTAVALDCTKNMDLSKIYDNCASSGTTHAFGASNGASEKTIYSARMRGFSDGCTDRANSSYIRLKNHACIYFSSYNIFIDVNGPQGPNSEDVDQISITLDANGITTEMP